VRRSCPIDDVVTHSCRVSTTICLSGRRCQFLTSSAVPLLKKRGTADASGDSFQVNHVVACAALMIKFEVATGSVTIERWPALTVVIVEPARLDMKNSSAGGMA
jgi:hypothetical protein